MRTTSSVPYVHFGNASESDIPLVIKYYQVIHSVMWVCLCIHCSCSTVLVHCIIQAVYVLYNTYNMSVLNSMKEPSLDASIYLLVLYYMNSGSLGQIMEQCTYIVALYLMAGNEYCSNKPSPAFRCLYFEAHNMHMCIPAV